MMKKLLQPILVLLAAMPLLVSCDKSDGINFAGEYEKSFQKWLAFEQANGNSYQFTVRPLNWFDCETTMTVVDGIVTQRSFRYLSGAPALLPVEDQEWTEYGDEVGSKKDPPAAAPTTLDKIYERARTDLLIKRKNVEHFFKADNDGMISRCGYVPNGVADADVGVWITSIEPM